MQIQTADSVKQLNNQKLSLVTKTLSQSHNSRSKILSIWQCTAFMNKCRRNVIPALWKVLFQNHQITVTA